MSRCGQIGLFGRPNVGKSTLLNCLVGAKVSITSRKPNTTRHCLLGVLTKGDCQYVFVDTPGFDKSSRRRLDLTMSNVIKSAIVDVDVVVWVVDVTNWNDLDRSFAANIKSTVPVIVAVNKVDLIKKDVDLLFADFEKEVRSIFDPDLFCWISARKKQGTDFLLSKISSFLPEQQFFYPEDTLTDRSERFLSAEIIREKVFRCLGDELPYGSAVSIESFEDTDKITRIGAIIHVEKSNHKQIIIGKNGSLIKMIGTVSRQDIERLLGRKVFLSLWVKVNPGWYDNLSHLTTLGHEIIGIDDECHKK